MLTVCVHSRQNTQVLHFTANRVCNMITLAVHFHSNTRVTTVHTPAILCWPGLCLWTPTDVNTDKRVGWEAVVRPLSGIAAGKPKEGT